MDVYIKASIDSWKLPNGVCKKAASNSVVSCCPLSVEVHFGADLLCEPWNNVANKSLTNVMKRHPVKILGAQHA